MNNRTYKLIIFTGIFLIGLTSNIIAQTEQDETVNVKKERKPYCKQFVKKNGKTSINL